MENEVLKQKLKDMDSGLTVTLEPEEAESLGLTVDDAMDIDDAIEAATDSFTEEKI